MKFTGSIDINQPLHVVADLFADPNNLSEYQDGFIRRELVSGAVGEDDAVSRLYYMNRGREMELTETVVANCLPNSFEAHYHHKHMDNTLKTTFTAIGENRTRYDTDGEYLAFRGLVPRLMARLFPGVFAKQAQRWLDNFKRYAEGQHVD